MRRKRAIEDVEGKYIFHSRRKITKRRILLGSYLKREPRERERERENERKIVFDDIVRVCSIKRKYINLHSLQATSVERILYKFMP